MDDLEPDDESVNTPLVSSFLDSDDDSDDGEVLDELSEYGNAGKLRRQWAINSFDGDDLVFQCIIGFRKFVAYFVDTIVVEELESTWKNLVAIVKDVYVFVGSFTYIMDFMIFEDIGEFILRDMAEVVMGKPFRKMIMRFNEIHKFSDGTLHQIDEALDYRVKEFKASTLASTYSPLPEDSLLTQTGDMEMFMDWHNVSKPLPLGGPPGHIIIQSDFFFNKDLEYLRYGSKGSRHAHIFEGDRRAVRTHMQILSVIIIEVFSMYGYDYKKKIVLRRADLKEHIIAKRDFKYLYISDFEDLYLLNLQGHLNHLPPKDKKILTTVVNLWTRDLVIRQLVKDFKLGIKSYQTQLNLTKPRWDSTGFGYKHDYTVIDSPRDVTFRDKYGVQTIMQFNEIHKFNDGTLHQIDEALDYQVKEFKVNRMNPGLNTRFWTRKDVDRIKEFMFAIQKRLKTRRIFRNLESFVGGREKSKNKRRVPTEMELELEHTQQGSSYEVSWLFSLVHSFRALSALRRSGSRTASTAAKPCQGDSSEFYLITGSIYTDQQGTVVVAEADHCQTLQYTINHPIFNAHNDFLDSQNKISIAQNKIMKQMTSLASMCEMACQLIQKKQEEKQIEEEQVANARYWKIPACCDDDDDSAITPNEPVDSLSMRDEHLNTISATKSDEFIKSCVENLVPNLNVPEKICSNPLFEEEIIPIKIDQRHDNAESTHDSSLIISSKIDSLLDEFAGELTLLKSIPPGIDKIDCYPENEILLTKRLLYDNSSPRPPKEFVSKNSNADIESFSPSPIP
nr:hypothetical protein [Tanacetum cinerariifolium]